MRKEFQDAKIISKHKDYKDENQATAFYERTRMQELAATVFPVSEYPEGFAELLIGLMKYQNPVSMNVWHDRSKVIQDTSGNIGQLYLCTTWDNLCTLQRPFTMAEM